MYSGDRFSIVTFFSLCNYLNFDSINDLKML